jgi:hypothetical protein
MMFKLLKLKMALNFIQMELILQWEMSAKQIKGHHLKHLFVEQTAHFLHTQSNTKLEKTP